jgi:hypothetical protein
MPRFPARLHVLLARDAPVGLVIRRGPAKSVATILWNRRTDTFELGQWLRGRIYDRQSDLSPDGKHFLYFALNGKWKSKVGGSWTAISRAPYLKAVSLWSNAGCLSGGGLWNSAKRYWLGDGCAKQLRDDTSLKRDSSCAAMTRSGHGAGVYYHRLIRDGWLHLKTERTGQTKDRQVDIFEKQANTGWMLRKLTHVTWPEPGKGCYWDEHVLLHPETKQSLVCPNWEWADFDGKRVVWATEGRLEVGRLTRDGIADPKVLHDFNAMEFAAIKAPY